jgi:endothelin-converting enzyme
MINEFGKYLDKDHRQPLDNLSKALGDGVSGLDRSKNCVSTTIASLPDIVSHYYVEATFPKPAFGQIDEMINTLRTTYAKTFQSVNWLDSFTRKGALTKLKGLLHKVGYSTSGPDDSSPTSLDKFHKDFKLDGKEYFGNNVRKNEFWARNEFRKLNKKVDRKHMDMSAPTVNSYYDPTKNDMNMIAGIMQRPLYNVNSPQYLNYGSVGTIAGHEMTHGFDNNGRKWDADGAYRNVSCIVFELLWTP